MNVYNKIKIAGEQTIVIQTTLLKDTWSTAKHGEKVK